MGYGDMMMHAAVAREICRRNPGKRVVVATPPRLLQRLRGRRWRKVLWSDVFENSPYIEPDPENADPGRTIVFYPDDRAALYFVRRTRKRLVFKPNAHAIEIACAAVGINDPEVRSDIHLSDEERETARRLTAGLDGRAFVAIEPNLKNSFTPNKEWPFERWREVVERLSPDLTFVQVGAGGGPVLPGVLDLSGRTTFREAVAVIERARLYMGPEGGLMHGAAAVGTRAVLVWGGYVSPQLTGYAGHTHLAAPVPCTPCGYRVACPVGLGCIMGVQPDEVVAAVNDALAPAVDGSG